MFKILGRLAYKLFKVEVAYKGNWQQDNKWLIDHKFKTIIDIGANEGQFAAKMRQFFPEATIHSFEPIPAVFDILKQNFNGDSRFKPYCYGLGDKNETVEFFANEYSPSSSLLKMTEHLEHFDKAQKAKPINIQITTLNEILKDQKLEGPVLVKIDVQGFEDKVIAGGKDILAKADMVICEVSFFKLYENQQLFDNIYQTMKSLGFAYQGNYEQLLSPKNKQILQADAIFAK